VEPLTRYQDGNATALHAFEWDVAGSAGVIVNMSVWRDVEHLAAFVYGPLGPLAPPRVVSAHA
jgi:hypothetical protein